MYTRPEQPGTPIVSDNPAIQALVGLVWGIGLQAWMALGGDMWTYPGS